MLLGTSLFFLCWRCKNAEAEAVVLDTEINSVYCYHFNRNNCMHASHCCSASLGVSGSQWDIGGGLCTAIRWGQNKANRLWMSPLCKSWAFLGGRGRKPQTVGLSKRDTKISCLVWLPALQKQAEVSLYQVSLCSTIAAISSKPVAGGWQIDGCQ